MFINPCLFLINIIILTEHLIESEQDFVTLGKKFYHIMYVLINVQSCLYFSFKPHFKI